MQQNLECVCKHSRHYRLLIIPIDRQKHTRLLTPGLVSGSKLIGTRCASESVKALLTFSVIASRESLSSILDDPLLSDLLIFLLGSRRLRTLGLDD